MKKNNEYSIRKPFILLCILAGFTLQASSQDVSIKDKNGFFKGTVDSRESVLYNVDKAKGPIEFCKLSFAIWTLMGEPVYDFKFYWEFDEGAYWQHKGEMVYLKELKKYPDLYQRMKSIEPLPDLEIHLGLHIIDSVGFNRWGYAEISANIDLPGKASEDCFSVPESPDWNDLFLDGYLDLEYGNFYTLWSDEIQAELKKLGKNIYVDKDDPQGNFNKALYSMAHGFEVHYMHIEKIEWPEAEINSILEEYVCREENKGDCNKNDPPKDEPVKDIWDSPAPKKALSQKDFWDDNPGGGNSDEEDFWDQPDEEGEIKRDVHGKGYAVIGKRTGRILIPYQKYKIISYTDGLAMLRKDLKSESRDFGCEKSISLYFHETWYINLKGEKVSAPKKKILINYSDFDFSMNLFSVTYEGETETEKKAREAAREKREAEEREEKLRCGNQAHNIMRDLKTTYAGQGFEVTLKINQKIVN